MPLNLYCHTCGITLPLTAQRCTACGNKTTLAPNTILQSPTELFEIQSVLGIGGMGIVYKAFASTGQDAVVKELYVDDPADLPDAQRRFRREADIQQSISHTAFPAGYGYFQDPSDPNREFAAMEFVPGHDLEKELANQPAGMMHANEVLRLGIEICEGLDVLHRHTDPAGNPDPLVHRDIKPANIILRPSGHICILDLGITRTVRQSAGTAVRATRAGTFEYCSPQQVSGTDMSIRDDIYSLAATLFHLATGNAFVGDFTQRAQEVDALPPAWQPIFRRAIQNDTNLRQRSMAEFRNDLANLLPAHLRPAQTAQPAPQPTPQPVPPAATSQISIRWKPSAPAMINPGEYRQAISGQVMRGGIGMAGVTVTPFVTDIGGAGSGTGAASNAVTTGLHGDFALATNDITVPVAVSSRQIELVVEDPNTGAELHRETVTINRPWNASVAQAGGVIKKPFSAIGQWWRNRQLAQAAVITAKANAKAARIAAQAQAYQAKQAAKLANAQAKAAAAQVRAQSGAAPVSPRVALLLAAALMVATLIAARLQVIWPGGPFGFVWALTLPFCLMTAYASWRLKALSAKAANLAAAGNAPAWSPSARALRQAYINPLSLVYYLGLLGWVFKG